MIGLRVLPRVEPTRRNTYIVEDINAMGAAAAHARREH
jgi:hypothetical protein